jgi:hypothetical protein
MRQHRVLDRNENADIARRGVDGAKERHPNYDGEYVGIGKRNAGRQHRRRAGEEQAAQVETRRNETDAQREDCGSEKRRRGDEPDLARVEAALRQISRQHDDGEAIPEPAQGTRGVEQKQV